MASVAQQNLISFLSGWVSDFIQNLSGVSENLAEYYKLSARIHAARSRIIEIQGKSEANKADFAANEQELREKLGAFVPTVAGKVKPACMNFFAAVGDHTNESNSPTGIGAAITVYGQVLALVRRYKLGLRPETDLRGLVDEALVTPLAAYPMIWLHKEFNVKVGEETDSALAAVAALSAELRALFDINLFNADPALFESNAAIMDRLNGETGEMLDQANQARASIVEALSAIAGVVSHAAEVADELKPEEAREAVRKYLVAPLKAIPRNGFSDDLVPDATKNIKSILKHEGEEIGDAVEKRIWEQLRQSAPDLFPAQAEPESHPCGAPCRSHDGRCQRRTSEDYCYQHGDTPGPDAQPLAGKWCMSGQQSGIEHSGWEADLTLEKSGAATWHQTKGANAGAKRAGRWQWNRGVFTLVYRAPHTGRVEWQAWVTPTAASSMGGDYRTPEVAPVGTGWGGTWSASRAVA